MQPHVVHVIAGLGLGGAERMLVNLVGYERPEKPRQTVVNLLPDGEFRTIIQEKGVALRSLGLSRPTQAVSGAWRLARLFRELEPSAIQSWMYNADLMSYWAWQWSGLKRTVPLYWGVRCSDMDLARYPRRLRLTVQACARRSGRVSGIVVNSRAGVSAHRDLGYDTRRVTVIENGIDLRVFRPDPAAGQAARRALDIAPDATIVLHVARVDPMKDHALMLKVAAARPDLTFLAVGTGTQALTGPPNVRGLGPRQDMPALYNAADIAILTSAFGEGFPNVLGEAMACGTPVVTTEVGDAAVLVDNTGQAVPTGDDRAFVTALDTLLKTLDTLPNPRRRIEEHYSLHRAVDRFDRLHIHRDTTKTEPA